MAYTIDKNGSDRDVLINGFENGIASSPHKGLANIKNGNIATETGEVMASFGRAQLSMTSTASSGTLTFVDSSHVALNISGSNNNFKGMWISVSSSSHTGELANGTYYVVDTSPGFTFNLSATYGGSGISGFTSGLTATIALIRTVGRGVGYTIEQYFISGTPFYRYYVLDHQGLVWVFDTSTYDPTNNVGYWFLPDKSITYWSTDTTPSGLSFINGTLIVFSGNKIWVKQSVNLGADYVQMTNAIMMGPKSTTNPHFGLSGHQGRVYYTDGPFVGSIFPDTSLITGVANIQSYASWSGASSTGTITQLYSGTTPSTGANVSQIGFSRIPAVFFTSTGGAIPASMSTNTIYYISYSTANETFEVYDALTGGSAKDLATGASGTQYYNTFWVVGTHSGAYGDTATMVFSPTRLQLPQFEISKCLTEVGNIVLVGCKGSVVYPWNQVSNTPAGLINLPEANVFSLLNVNQIAYIFAGYKGNVYVTDGSTASLVLKIPDYCAGIEGTPSSYIEPIFNWGGSAYIRGRVYFSVLDQTSTKAGNCGGIWSFYPTQNLSIDQDTGLALHIENINSYATYNGYATLIIPWIDQNIAKAPQFWSCWQSALTSPAYGFDQTSTTPIGTVIIETDLVPVGTVLNKFTPKQLEYKLSTALLSGETVTVKWRKNSTDVFVSAGNVITPDGATSLAGYFNANFQGAQWVQLQWTLTPQVSASSSFVRFSQARIR